MGGVSVLLNFIGKETHRLRGIFADADAVRAVLPRVVPVYKAMNLYN